MLRSKKKKPNELVVSTRRHIAHLDQIKSSSDSGEKEYKKTQSKISKDLSAMKFMLYGDGDTEPKPAEINALTEKLFEKESKSKEKNKDGSEGHEVLIPMLNHMKQFDFEARKDVAQIYNFVLRQRSSQAEKFVKENPNILKTLVNGYGEPEIALNCGSILREVIRHKGLNEILLEKSELFNKFFGYVQLSTFDVASDAFATFKLMLTKHRRPCADFMLKNFDDVFKQYNVLLQSNNYVTKRQSLKLLGELLLARANYNVMMKYINLPENLIIMMRLLRGNTKAIQFEAFHVFKIFVANPKKDPKVVKILYTNKDKLIGFLTKFTKEPEDPQFEQEKTILLDTLRSLKMPEPTSGSGSGSGGSSTTTTATSTTTTPTTGTTTSKSTEKTETTKDTKPATSDGPNPQ